MARRMFHPSLLTVTYNQLDLPANPTYSIGTGSHSDHSDSRTSTPTASEDEGGRSGGGRGSTGSRGELGSEVKVIAARQAAEQAAADERVAQIKAEKMEQVTMLGPEIYKCRA